MGWQLSPGVGYCRVGGEIVFQDLGADRYFALGARDRDNFDRLCGGGDLGPADIARFTHAGLLRRGPSGIAPPPSIDIPDRDIHGCTLPQASLAGVALTTLCVVRAQRAIAPHRLRGTLDRLAVRRAKLAGLQVHADASEVAALFEASRGLVPVARRCLPDSVALLAFLLAKGRAADLVFGVRLAPFSAHCWLQNENVVLTCALDEARAFTPIWIL